MAAGAARWNGLTGLARRASVRGGSLGRRPVGVSAPWAEREVAAGALLGRARAVRPRFLFFQRSRAGAVLGRSASIRPCRSELAETARPCQSKLTCTPRQLSQPTQEWQPPQHPPRRPPSSPRPEPLACAPSACPPPRSRTSTPGSRLAKRCSPSSVSAAPGELEPDPALPAGRLDARSATCDRVRPWRPRGPAGQRRRPKNAGFHLQI